MLKNKKGFTLIELLAVIVILGVVMSIAVPTYTDHIYQSKRRAFVVVAESYVNNVSAGITSGLYKAPQSKNDVTIVNLNAIELYGGNYISPFDSNWVDNKSYVAVINSGTSLEPNYEFYFAAQDEERNAIPLTKITDINESTIINDARNTMEVTVQSLAGNISGNNTQKGIIIGLDNMLDEKGNKIDWNVTIYSK